MIKETPGGEGTTGVVFDFGAPCPQGGQVLQDQPNSSLCAPLTITSLVATSATPLARPADQLAEADVVEVYCEAQSDKPLLYQSGYHLYAALTRATEDRWFHGAPCLIAPLGRGFVVRLPRADAWRVLSLDGKVLEVGWNKARVRTVAVREIEAAQELYATMVMFDLTIREEGGPKHGKKRCKTGANLLLSLGAALERMGVQGARVALDEEERRLDIGKKGAVHGQGVTLTNLQPHDSIKIQKMGIGAKGRMGCGVFIPLVKG